MSGELTPDVSTLKKQVMVKWNEPNQKTKPMKITIAMIYLVDFSTFAFFLMEYIDTIPKRSSIKAIDAMVATDQTFNPW